MDYSIVKATFDDADRIKFTPTLWIKDGNLHWPNGFVDRRKCSEPSDDCTVLKCTVLMSSIGK